MSKAVEIIDVYTGGDTLPPLARVHDNGNTDITGWAISLRLKQPDGFLVVKAATIDNGPLGIFSFAWAAGDLVGDDALQEAEIEFSPSGGGQFTEGPIFFRVRKQLL